MQRKLLHVPSNFICISSRRCTLYWSVRLGPILWYTRTYEHDYKRDSPLKLWLKYFAGCQNIGKLLKVLLLWILDNVYSLQYASKTSLSNSIIWWEGKGGTSLPSSFTSTCIPSSLLQLFPYFNMQKAVKLSVVSSQTVLLTGLSTNIQWHKHTETIQYALKILRWICSSNCTTVVLYHYLETWGSYMWQIPHWNQSLREKGRTGKGRYINLK